MAPGRVRSVRRVMRAVAAAVAGLAVVSACGQAPPVPGATSTPTASGGAPPTASPAPATASPTQAPATASPVPPTPGGPAAPARFTPCDGGFECATIPVPVDYRSPAGPTLPLAIVRQPARDQANKLGVLLVNPGGPGGSGIETVESGVVPPEVAARFDVIGFDPRGVGRSLGLQCPVGPEAPYQGDPDPGDPADEAATDAAVDRYDAGCGRKYGDLLPHLGTRNVARDMDRIRAALGQEKINYLGFSYGTSIGQTYAQMFGDRVRTMVLDGVVDVSQPGLNGSQAESFESSLRQFAADCAARPSCPAGPDPIAVVDRVEARLAANPLPVPGSTPLTAGLFEIGLALPLYSKDNWPVLARALAAADRGDGSGMRRLAEAYFTSSNSDTYNAVTCLDSTWPTEDAQAFAASRDIERRAPHFSGNVLVSALTCADWPTPQQPLTPIEGPGAPPMLILGTTNDPATPYRNSVELSRRLPDSSLLTYRGDGHTVYGNGVPCIEDKVNQYLLSGVLPPPATC